MKYFIALLAMLLTAGSFAGSVISGSADSPEVLAAQERSYLVCQMAEYLRTVTVTPSVTVTPGMSTVTYTPTVSPSPTLSPTFTPII